MDCEPEELQFLSIPGILHESTKLILTFRKLFTKLTLTLILPLSLLFLSHIYISHRLFSAIRHDDRILDHAAPNSEAQSSALHHLFNDWASVILFKSLYLLALLLLSLLCTAAVVYSVASIYTSRDLSDFSKVLSVVPKVWRRLAVTFLFAFAVLVVYHIVAGLVLVVLLVLAGDNDTAAAVEVGFLFPVYLVGLVYLSVVWHLASVVAVLEDVGGIGAMRKAKELIKGKVMVGAAIFVLLNICFLGVEFGFRHWVVRGGRWHHHERARLGGWERFLLSVLMVVLLCGVMVVGLVAQTVVYFVCKSYHHESIDKSSLADHLEVYLGEYVPLQAKDVQMEQLHV